MHRLHAPCTIPISTGLWGTLRTYPIPLSSLRFPNAAFARCALGILRRPPGELCDVEQRVHVGTDGLVHDLSDGPHAL
jgi:hypothetical protein